MISKSRNDELGKILERVVGIGLRGGWAEFEETPLMLPRVQLVPPIAHSSSVDAEAEGSSTRAASDSPQ